MIMLFGKQKGDTIVEVLIAIAVVSVVLAGAYSIAGRSLNNIRQAQEHTEALKIAQNQVESLKQLSDSNGGNDFGAPSKSIFGGGLGTFCLDSAVIKDTTPPNCQVSNGVTYNIAIDRHDNGYQHTFTVHVLWDSLVKNGQDEVTLTYNLDT